MSCVLKLSALTNGGNSLRFKGLSPRFVHIYWFCRFSCDILSTKQRDIQASFWKNRPWGSRTDGSVQYDWNYQVSLVP